MPLSNAELEDFDRNQIHPDSLASKVIYEKYRHLGLSHNDSLRRTIDDVDSLTSSSIDDEQLRLMKRAFFTQPGMF
ncbi:MAG: hypothetical protein K2Q18_06135 [Bdellovibrionales bacterium]|nr:hypothetical protein [Bdellovibrionales bacterium]